MNKAEIEEIESIYWRIRKAYPLTSWHNPKNSFEKTIQQVLSDFGDLIRNHKKSMTKHVKVNCYNADCQFNLGSGDCSKDTINLSHTTKNRIICLNCILKPKSVKPCITLKLYSLLL